MAGNLTPSSPDPLQPAGGGLPAAREELYPTAYNMAADEDQGVQWGRYIAALKRYKWLILLVTVVGTGLGIVATRFIDPEYTVRAKLWIQPRDEGSGPIRPDPLVESVAWVELLQTGAVLNSVVREEGLVVKPADESDAPLFRDLTLATDYRPGKYVLKVADDGARYVLQTSKGAAVDSAPAGSPIGESIGFAWSPPTALLSPGETIEFTVVSTADATAALRSRLTPLMAENGSFLEIVLVGSDPEQLASTMNTLAAEFVERAAELKSAKLVEQAGAVKRQLDSLKQEMLAAETRLEGYRTSTITQPNEGVPLPGGLASTQGTFTSRYFADKFALDSLNLSIAAIQTVLQRAQSGDIAVDQFLQIPAVQAAPNLQAALQNLATAQQELRTLRLRYTDKATPVQQQLQTVEALRTQTIPALAEQVITGLRRQARALEGQIAEAEQELEQVPTRTITEQRLQGEVNVMRDLYSQVAERHQFAQLALASAIPDLQVLDWAVAPRRPSSNQAPRIILLAFMASLGAAVGLAILLDQLDKRFRYPDQVTRELGLSILGAIPAIKRLKPGERDHEEAAQVVEAFRTVRMNLVHSYGAAGPVLLTVSSPGPGDGKSLVSSNLALSFAEAGYRTLLIDGDIRRGELHRMFSSDRRPGLLDQLTGEVPLESILRPTTHRNLALIPCGTRHQHGPELLGSSAMRELMAALKSRYDVVIIDSPPLGAGIDPFVLSTATGNLMLVLRSGETDRQMAEAKLRLLDRLPVRILGAVLNDIQTTGVYKYYAYIYGYTADEESVPPRLAAR